MHHGNKYQKSMHILFQLLAYKLPTMLCERQKHITFKCIRSTDNSNSKDDVLKHPSYYSMHLSQLFTTSS